MSTRSWLAQVSSSSKAGACRWLVSRVGGGGRRLCKRCSEAELRSRLDSTLGTLLGSLFQPPWVKLLPHPLLIFVRREIFAVLLLCKAPLVLSIPAGACCQCL